ncbi:zinc ribbon domain-containing protein [Sporolactobacillus sp. Y61]|jgi:uncharacterized membrane protein YvbJ|uniref:Zinc ribbon domain-containing protein n=1 Tax=Sporolactobacillus sp. Y61 TaxID=3160863 RepID=A0AAU8IIM3_9BACL|nr:zinc ribbon domain-containing protein [Sporolactobacillus sp. THM19-2]RYL94025.1 zinc ribbon domain-containing protein [Sporolactobacillus sp. THM19-2]
MAENFCRNCGSKCEPGQKFCTRCGQRLAEPAETVTTGRAARSEDQSRSVTEFVKRNRKWIIPCVILAVVAFFFFRQMPDNSPSGVTGQFLEYARAGKYNDAEKQIAEITILDLKDNNQYSREKMTATLYELVHEGTAEIKNIRIVREQKSSDTKYAGVLAALTFDDGTKRQLGFELIKEKGKWKIDHFSISR